MELLDAILDTVKHQSGIKGTNLVLDVMAKCNIQKFNAIDYHHTLAQLISAGEIIELEYIGPDMPERIKSVYFQKGTIVINK